MNQSAKKAAAIAIAVCTFVVVTMVTVNVALVIIRNTISGIVYTTDTANPEFVNRYSRLDEVYTRLMEQYYQEVESDKLIQGAIDGMMASLGDQYTFYYTPEEMTETTQNREGIYVGIGIEVTGLTNGDLLITRVFRNGPACEAGLLVGDVLLNANGYELKASNSKELSESVDHIKGPEGSLTHLTVRRFETEMELDVECRSVVNSRVEYDILEGNIGYIALYSFFGDAVDGMESALTYMIDNQAEAVIIDLRGNTGGQLDICVEICDMLLPEGVVVYTENRNGDRDYYYSSQEHFDIPIAVLVNGSSASASEILTAAVQDYQRGLVIGTNTFGKGIVQTWYQFPVDGAGMQLTTSAYYTPNGRSIHKIGISPDVYVEPDEVTEQTIIEGMTLENDSVLRTAWEILKGEAYEAG